MLSAHSATWTPVHMVVDDQESDRAEALASSAYLVLSDQPYNTIGVRDDLDCNHDIFASADMQAP